MRNSDGEGGERENGGRRERGRSFVLNYVLYDIVLA